MKKEKRTAEETKKINEENSIKIQEKVKNNEKLNFKERNILNIINKKKGK